MANVCSINEFIISPTTTTGVYWYWDKVNKIVSTKNYGSVTGYYTLNAGSLIDIAQVGGQVYAITKASNISFPINENILTSASGDHYNTLLSATYSSSTHNVTVVMWATNAKEQTTFTFPMQVFTNDSPAIAITPCFNNFTIADNVIINVWCDGFTLNEVVTSGGAAITRQTINSITCGYSAPIGPFRFSERKLIEYRKCVLLNPILFVWKNTIGGWDYWLFQVNQTQHIDTVSLGYFQKNYTKISDISNPQAEIGKQVTTRIILGADDLTIQQVKGLKGLLISNKIYILNQDGSVSREVILLPGTFLIQDTSDSLHSLEFEIQDVAINTITN